MFKIKDILKTNSILFKKIILISCCFLLSLAVYMGITVVYAAWQDPLVAPESDKFPAPLNVSSNIQEIEDSKIINIKSDGMGKLSIQGKLKITGTDVAIETTGGLTRATGGLIIETRSGSDPISPEVGRIWLRTDLGL